MPWWAIGYAVSYFVLSVMGDLFTYREYKSKVYWGCESAAHFGIGVLLVGYWITPIPESIGLLGVAFFLFAVLWEIVTSIGTCREAFSDSESSSGARALSVLLPIILVGPAYVGAGLAVFR